MAEPTVYGEPVSFSDDTAEIVATATSPYQMTEADINELTDAIYDAMVDAASSAAEEIIAEVDAEVDIEDLVDAVSDDMQQEAADQAQEIAQTYSEELTQEGNRLVNDYEHEHGTLAGAAEFASLGLSSWVAHYGGWKAAESAITAAASGMDTFMNGFFSDLVQGLLEKWLQVPLDQLVIAILPEYTMSPDICNEYAGNYYDVTEYLDLPDFPIHPNCIHRKVLLTTDSVDLGDINEDSDFETDSLTPDLAKHYDGMHDQSTHGDRMGGGGGGGISENHQKMHQFADMLSELPEARDSKGAKQLRQQFEREHPDPRLLEEMRVGVKDWTTIGQRVLGTRQGAERILTGQGDHQTAHFFLDLIQHMPKTAPALSRGVAMERGQLQQILGEGQFDIALGSFTSDHEWASFFPFLRGHTLADPVSVVFRLEEGSRSINIQPWAQMHEFEWMSSGRFQVVGQPEAHFLDMSDGRQGTYIEIHIRQIGTFAVSEFIPQALQKHYDGMHDQSTHGDRMGGGGGGEIPKPRRSSFDEFESLRDVTFENAGKRGAEHTSVGSDLTHRMIQEQWGGAKPEVVSRSELNTHIEGGEHELFRGSSARNREAVFFSDHGYTGYGIFGDGTYTYDASSMDRQEALLGASMYTGPGGEISRMSLRAGARIVDYTDLDIERGRFADRMVQEARAATLNHDHDKAESFLREALIAQDPSRYAVMKGYDAVSVTTLEGSKFVVVLNLGAVRIQTDVVDLKSEMGF